MKMKKELYLAIILLILIPSESVFAQVNLSDIAEEGGLISKKDEKRSALDKDEEDDPKASTRVRQKLDSEDKNYGYTGGKNFINPPQEKFFDEPLSYFGYEFFEDAPTDFAPEINIPVPPDYILGPNDEVNLITFGARNSTYDLTVNRDGEIFFPGFGPINVSGLTFTDVKETLETVVENQLLSTKVRVSMGNLRSMDIFVLGEVHQPGVYTVSALASLTNAIFQSGGVNLSGSLRNIQLKRKGKVISTFDFYDLLLKGDTSKDIRLKQGDVVFIPPITKTAGLAGEVTRPGIYELKQNETLGDLIKYAGNLKPKADLFSATLWRVDPSSNGFKLISVAVNDSSLESYEIKNGDVFNLFPVSDHLKNAVLITGHAQQPGFYPWQEGMRVRDLIKSKDNLLSKTDLTYVLVKRENKLNQSYEYLQVDLEEVFSNDAIDSNITLKARDEIILFPSLLTPEQITTELIEDSYVIEGDEVVLDLDKWPSMTYLRKSLMERPLSIDQAGGGVPMINPASGMPFAGDVKLKGEFERYYEYSIYDYCVISEDLALMVIEALGFRPKTKVPFEDLEELESQEDLDDLLAEIRNEKSKVRDLETSDQDLEKTLTDVCRRQLLDPVMDVLNRQSTPNKETETVQVFGSVHFPGTYPLTNGMVLNDAVKAAGGLKSATYSSEIEISRVINSGKEFTTANMSASLSGEQTSSTPLKAMDVINLKQLSSGLKTVEITGEVYFSGVYPISENQTLGELVTRAGGITEYGSVKAAFFQRESLKVAELERLESARKELRRKILLTSSTVGLGQGTLGPDIVTLYSTLLTRDDGEIEAIGRLVVDLESVLDGSIEDVLLEDGDTIHIPTIQQSVSVIGEVFVANSHLFQSGYTIDDYIGLSGGANDFADEANVYLIKVDGSIVPPSQITGRGFFKRSWGLQPGDTVVVPLEVQPFSAIKATTEITQIVYQMALAAAAVNSF